MLELNVGSAPEQIGYTLTCNDVDTLWNVQVGTMAEEPDAWRTETACVSDETTCTLELILGETNIEPFFVLSQEATTIAVSSQEDKNLTEPLSYCLGPDCDKLPLEIAEMDNPDSGDGDDNAAGAGRSIPTNTVNHTAMIVGITSAILLVLIGIALYVCLKRRKRQQSVADKGVAVEDDTGTETSDGSLLHLFSQRISS